MAGLVVGFNASQLDGDDFRGYSKVGLNAGLAVEYRIPSSKRLGLGLEMLFSMKGSTRKLNPSSGNNVKSTITLNYVEIPVYLRFREWNLDFHGGMSYGRLISSKTNEFTIYLPEDFKKDDLSVVLGVNYRFNEHFGAGARFTRSVVNIVNKEVNKDALVGHLLSFRVGYMF
jgi:hypothetical protein